MEKNLTLSSSLHSYFIAYIQLLFWLLFRPTAWRDWVADTKLKLSPDFAWYMLNLEQWRHPLLRPLLLIHVAGLVFVGIVVGLCLYSFSWLWGIPDPTITPLKGVIYATTLYFVTGVISAITISVAFSFVASIVSSLLIGLFFFSGEWYRDAILCGIFAASLASKVLIGLTPKYSLKIGSIFISLVVTNVILISTISIGSVVIYFPFFDPQVLVLTFGIVFISGFTTHNWKLAGILGSGFWVIATVLINIVEPHTLIKSVTGSLSNGVFFTFLFALPYLLARKIATTSLSGIVAGLLSCWSVYTFFFVWMQDSPIFLLLSLIALGLPWWRQLWLIKLLDITRFFQPNFLQGLIFEGASQVKIATAAGDEKIENPYTLVPLSEKTQLFVGRNEASDALKNFLQNQYSSPILLYGQRRIGKTSLILQLNEMLPDKYVPLFIDLQRVATATTLSDFLDEISYLMIRSAHDSRQLTLPDISYDPEKNATKVFYRWLDEIEDNLKGYTFLMSFDEFEALDGVFKKGYLDRDLVLWTFRYIIQHYSCFKILFAGAYRFDEDKFRGWANYLVNVQVLKLDYLKESEAKQLIKKPTEDFNLRYTDEAIQRILSLTHCQPACVQLLCKEIVFLKNEENINTRYLVEKKDVEKAIPKALEHGSLYFIDIIQKRSSEENKLLSFLADKGEGEVISLEVLSEQCENIDEVLSNLEERQIVERTPEGYGFQVELIRRYFSKKEKD